MNRLPFSTTQHVEGEPGEKGENPYADPPEQRANAGRQAAKFIGDSTTPAQSRDRMIAAARRALGREPLQTPPYPVEALGALQDASRSLAKGGQMRIEVAGQALLSVAAHLSQSRSNVRSLDGVKPISLYLLTIADSGDGKTAADSIAQRAVQQRQRAETSAYLSGRAAGAASRKSYGENDARHLREPYRIMRDGTVQGIRRAFASGVPSQAVISSEAATMLAGSGMTSEHRRQTAAVYNELWDVGEVSAARAGSRRMQLYDRRLSIHWLIQPDAIEDVLYDSTLSTMGFWPRFLVSWPEPSSARTALHWHPESDSAILAHWHRCDEMMEIPLGEDCGNLRELELTREATRLLGDYFERMEAEAKGRLGYLADIRPYALRATELAARIAGVLAEYANHAHIDAETIRSGMTLATYSLDTWRGILGDRDRATAIALAMRLYEWLITQPTKTASETAILRVGPKCLRSKWRRDTALAVLEQAGLISRQGHGVWAVQGAPS